MIITFNVRAKTKSYETVRLVGNVSELGLWNYEESVELVYKGDHIWSVKVDLSAKLAGDLKYRYIICRYLQNLNKESVLIITSWETHLEPRVYDFKNGYSHNDEFGLQNNEYKVDEGWLTRQSEIRLTIRGDAVQIVNINDSDQLSFYVTPVDQFFPLDEYVDKKGYRDDYLCTDMLYSVLNEGTSFREQPRYGHQYINGDYLMFRTQTLIACHLAFRFDFYSLQQSHSKNSKFDRQDGNKGTRQKIGHCLLHPVSQSSGSISCAIMSLKNNLIGHLTVHYLVVNPVYLENLTMDTSASYIRYWKRRKTLNFGHRGMGKSFSMKALARENTIRSFNMAAKHGADFVEFDVQLTNDLLPVVYHDFEVFCDIAKHGKPNSKDCEKLRVWLKDVKHEELLNSKLFHRCDFAPISSDNDEEYNEPFPLLRDTLLKVNPDLGFNVEIKYPMQMNNGVWECEHFFEHNLFVDKILSVIFKYGSPKRKIVFSSFEPNICVMLKLKQNRYPVLFLSQGATKRYTPYVDDVCNSSQMAIDFALCNEFLGVSLHSEDLLIDERPVEMCRKMNLVCFVWGNDLAECQVQDKFRQMSCDAVIFDNINTANVQKSKKKNATEN